MQTKLFQVDYLKRYLSINLNAKPHTWHKTIKVWAQYTTVNKDVGPELLLFIRRISSQKMNDPMPGTMPKDGGVRWVRPGPYDLVDGMNLNEYYGTKGGNIQ